MLAFEKRHNRAHVKKKCLTLGVAAKKGAETAAAEG
jgi:hypothetical protein